MWVDWEFLPRKTISSGAIFLNEQGQLLVVKPNYKEGWNLPGGIIDKDESPIEACNREVKEEIGLIKNVTQLVSVQYVKNASHKHDNLRFIFWGGVLTNKEIESIKLQKEELSEFKFIEVKDVKEYLSTNLSQVVEPSIMSAKEGRIFYSEV